MLKAFCTSENKPKSATRN